MAAPSLRIVRQSRRSLTAASQPITDPNAVFRSSLGFAAASRDWQDDAWDMLDLVGELRYYVSWRASSCSRVRLVASDVNPDTGLPTGATENRRVTDIVNAIAGGALGQSQFLKRATECLTVPGEFWAVIIVTDAGVRWLVVTADEMHKGARGTEIDLPEGGRHLLDLGGQDSMFRVWNPRPRKAAEPDSPVRATLDSLHEIVRTTKTIASASKSRLVGNGIVFLPQELSLPPVNAPGTSTTEGTPAIQQLQELLWSVADTAYDDSDSMAALIPILATVPGEQIKNVQHLRWDNDVTELAVKVRNDAVARLAMGLDVSPERLLGLGSNQNHWNAWLTTDQDVQLHIAPVMETICQALNTVVLGTVLEREGLDPKAYMVWYDAGSLTADPDKTDNATAAFDRGTITAEAYRDYLGLGEDIGYDYTTLEGWQRWAQDHVSAKPELIGSLAPLLGPISEVYPELSQNFIPGAPAALEVPAPQAEPQTQTSPEEPVTASGFGGVRSAVVDLMVSRALELAGKRRRSRADHARLRDVPAHRTHHFLPAVTPAEVPKLIDGWDAALEDEVLARLGVDGEELRAEVRRLVRKQLTAQVVDG